MPLYLGRFSYTTDSVKALLANPHDRAKAASEAAETIGAKMLGFWWALGEFDGVFLLEAPDNMTAAALSMLVGGSGALSRLETTVLLSMEEGNDALRKAADAAYRTPAG
jgi:uncharacterized protein with GYD domain